MTQSTALLKNSAAINASDPPENDEVAAEAEQDDTVKKKRKASKRRGAGAEGRRKRGGKAIQQADGDEAKAHQYRLGQKHLALATAHTSAGFSLIDGSRVSTTGWQGRTPSLKGKEVVLKAYNSGAIKAFISSHFYPVAFDE